MTAGEQRLERHLLDLGTRAYDRGTAVYSDFLDLNELNIFEGVRSRLSHIYTESYGGYEEAERRVVLFCPGAPVFCTDAAAYPIDCLEVENPVLKFSEALTHRDYLGAVLNLGIDRACIGDIAVEEDRAFIFCLKRMSDFICDNLTRVKHTTVCARRTDADGFVYRQKYREINGTAVSVRLDRLISIAFNESRSRLSKLIEGGKVYVNGKLAVSPDFVPKEGDLISVRGMGKFRVGASGGKSKKGRERITLYRYI